MPVYIAMLRGINVSGHNLMKMERLRASFETMGFGDIATYIQSGNVVFKSAKTANRTLEQKIAAQIKAEFGFDVPVVVRSSLEMTAVVKLNPFAGKPAVDETKLHVTFLAEPAPATAAAALKPIAHAAERFEIMGREIYLSCPNGYGETKLSNTAIEKKLGGRATTRNWKTVNVLNEMALKS